MLYQRFKCGPDQSVCAATATLAGNTAVIGAGTGTCFRCCNYHYTCISDFRVNSFRCWSNVLKWTISNGSCPPSIDTVIITRFAVPQRQMQVWRNPFVSLLRLPWRECSRYRNRFMDFDSRHRDNHYTYFSYLYRYRTWVGANTFRWTISNGPCALLLPM